MDFEALSAVPEAKLRQAAPHTIRLKTVRAKADTLLPEDHHYQVSLSTLSSCLCLISLKAMSMLGRKAKDKLG